MNKPRYVNSWECKECSELYSTKRRAKNCCKAETELINGWECSDCSKPHKNKTRARKCCPYNPDRIRGENYDLLKSEGERT